RRFFRLDAALVGIRARPRTNLALRVCFQIHMPQHGNLGLIANPMVPSRRNPNGDPYLAGGSGPAGGERSPCSQGAGRSWKNCRSKRPKTSLGAADTSGSPPFGRSLASLTQHPKWAGEIAINCFQIRSLARSSQRVVSGKCLRHESDPKQLLKGNAYRRTPWAKPLLRANAAAVGVA